MRTPEPVSQSTPVPPALDEIIARCLERDPQRRYLEIRELDGALAKVAAMGLPASPPARLNLADRPTTAYVRQTPPLEPTTSLGIALQEPTDVLTSAVLRPAPAPPQAEVVQVRPPAEVVQVRPPPVEAPVAPLPSVMVATSGF